MADQRPLRPSVVLAAYAEALAEGRRVLVLGDATSELASELVDRGARLVTVLDPERARVAEAAQRGSARGVSVAALDGAELGLRDGAFDLAIVEDLSQLGDAEATLARLRRLVAPRGAALIVSPNPEVRFKLLPASGQRGLDYYALYDQVARHFDEVRMLGQTPFVGYAIVDFGAADDDVEPALDSGFLPSGAEEPDFFVALASSTPVEVEAFAVVQLPFRSVIGGGRARDLEQKLARAERELQATRAEGATRDAELAERRVAERSREPEAPAELARLREALATQESWSAQLEARAATADERADEAEARSEALQAEASRLGSELEAARSEATQARSERTEAARRVAELEIELRAPRSDHDTEHAAEIAALEQQLATRGGEVSRLERELREAERIGRELVHELSELRAGAAAIPAAPAPLTARVAELESELRVARWQAEALALRTAGSEARRELLGRAQAALAEREPSR